MRTRVVEQTMRNRMLERAVLAALSCSTLLGVPAALAAEPDWTYRGDVVVDIETMDQSGDPATLQPYSDNLDDGVILDTLDLFAEKGRTYFGLTGQDIGRKDEFIGLSGGQYGLFDLSVSYDEWYRDYTDGVTLGAPSGKGYWAVPDSLQAALATGFTPLNVNPTAAGQALLNQALADARTMELDQQRKITDAALAFTPIKGLNLYADFTHENRDGSKAVASGSYRRSATGANSVGGLGENFRAYGLEYPMPTEYSTDGFNLRGDYRTGRWYFDLGYQYLKFDNDVNALKYDNPLLLVGQNGQVGGAALHRMVLAPDYTSQALNFTGAVSDLPLHSRLVLTFSQKDVKQDEAFYPYTANPALLDDSGQRAELVPLPAHDLDGKVTTTLVNVVLSSRPIDPLSVDLRYNWYDYNNDSKYILWTGWAGIGESTWKDYDGSVPNQNPYYNRVPEYDRSRLGLDAVYSFTSTLKLKGEYYGEKIDRNEDRNADTSEDVFRVTLQWMALDWATLRFGYNTSSRDIDGHYEQPQHGVQDEWEELRMFDQADRDSDGYNAYLGLDPLDNLSFGLSFTQGSADYDKEYYGLHELSFTTFGIDANWRIAEGYDLSAYFSRDEQETKQLNRTKSDKTGGGSFAIPQNDWRTHMDDSTDAYGAEFTAAIVPDKLTFSASVDYSSGNVSINTSNPDYLAGTTVSGAIAYPWPDVDINTTQLRAQLDYQWTKQLTTGLQYIYLKNDYEDFATDGALLYYGSVPTDSQGNIMSHQVFMGANPYDSDANVFALTVEYAF